MDALELKNDLFKYTPPAGTPHRVSVSKCGTRPEAPARLPSVFGTQASLADASLRRGGPQKEARSEKTHTAFGARENLPTPAFQN